MRGSFSAKGERVYAGTPRALPPDARRPAGQPPGPGALAGRRDNPLVARVIVNRLWEQLFGRGLVETSEDFGTQGEPPTHPELLDWLATRIRGEGLEPEGAAPEIVPSATYRQSSAVTAELAERDPYNRLFARGPRVRLEAEMIRDATLAASGLLSEKMCGPSVFPPQPDGIWNQPYNSDKWTAERGEDRYRRGLYTFWRRTSPYPLHDLRRDQPRVLHGAPRPHQHAAAGADAAERSGVVRGGTRAGTADGRREAATPAARAAWGVKLVLSRPAERGEVDRLVAVYEKESASYRQRGDADADLAAWTLVANVLLNLDEAIPRSSVAAKRWSSPKDVARARMCVRMGPNAQLKDNHMGLRSVTRRHFFEQASFGIGGLALASLIDDVVLARGPAGGGLPRSISRRR